MSKEIIKQGKLVLGKIDYEDTGKEVNLCGIDWELKEGNNGLCFSASGYIWDKRHYDWVSGGQNIDTLVTLFPKNKKLYRLYEIWNSYHLNDMNAGTPEQTLCVNIYLAQNKIRYDYTKVCEYLKSIDMYEIPYTKDMRCTGSFPKDVIDGKRGYRYGERWLYNSIPESIVKELMTM